MSCAFHAVFYSRLVECLYMNDSATSYKETQFMFAGETTANLSDDQMS